MFVCILLLVCNFFSLYTYICLIVFSFVFPLENSHKKITFTWFSLLLLQIYSHKFRALRNLNICTICLFMKLLMFLRRGTDPYMNHSHSYEFFLTQHFFVRLCQNFKYTYFVNYSVIEKINVYTPPILTLYPFLHKYCWM